MFQTKTNKKHNGSFDLFCSLTFSIFYQDENTHSASVEPELILNDKTGKPGILWPAANSFCAQRGKIISILQITFVGLLDLALLRVSRLPIFRSSQGVTLGIPVCCSRLFVTS